MKNNQNIDIALGEIAGLLGDRLSGAEAVRRLHGEDMTHFDIILPDAVAFAHSSEEVSEIVKICHRYAVPVIAFGAGTSLEGHFLAVEGGISIDLSQMNHIVCLNEMDLDITVEAGVTREQLNHEIRHKGLFFPIDPGANATLGGMAATRASGTNAVRYGTMRDTILALTVVTADGSIIKTASRARKSAAGYDLTRLYIGSEGTLGIITEVTLKLYGIPEAISAAVCPFASLEGAIDAVIQTIQMGIPIARIELVDEDFITILNQSADFDHPVTPTLFMEFHGSAASVREQAETVEDIASGHGGQDFRWATKTEDRNRLWKARHDGFISLRAAYPGKDYWVTDVCVPISRLSDCILQTHADLQQHRLFGPIVGHVGDGNFHVTLPYDKSNPAEVTKIENFNERLVSRALAMDGTCTGEHGIGLGKKKYLVQEHGEAVDVMKAIKRALDPKNILNPNKILDLS